MPLVVSHRLANAQKQTVGRIDNHVQGTRPNAVSASRIFVEYILCAYTRT